MSLGVVMIISILRMLMFLSSLQCICIALEIRKQTMISLIYGTYKELNSWKHGAAEWWLPEIGGGGNGEMLV